MIMKRALSLLLAFVMLLGMMPMGALATEETDPIETAEVTEATEVTEVIEEIEVAHQHEYESVVTEPACTEQGYQRKFSLLWWSCDSKQ